MHDQDPNKPHSFLELTEKSGNRIQSGINPLLVRKPVPSKKTADSLNAVEFDSPSYALRQAQQDIQDQQSHAAEDWHDVQRQNFLKVFR